MMPWVENRLSNGREGKKEAKVKGLSRKGIKLAAITVITINKNKQRLYKRAAFSFVDKD
jgi:hypothetical protein